MANTTTVELVKLVASNGRPIRLVTRVTINGRVVDLMERLSKRRAIEQASAFLRRQVAQ